MRTEQCFTPNNWTRKLTCNYRGDAGGDFTLESSHSGHGSHSGYDSGGGYDGGGHSGDSGGGGGGDGDGGGD